MPFQIGDVFEGYQTYAGSGHSLGLWIVHRIGQKFATLKGIKCEAISESNENVDAVSSTSYQKRKAITPWQYNGEQQRLAISSYDDKLQCGSVGDGSLCDKIFKKLMRNDNEEIVYIKKRQLFY
jgi:hypothetical protein